MSAARRQRTISRPSIVEGFGYFSGRDVRVEFRPASVGTGVTFVRRDLEPKAKIPARPELRIDVPRRTTLAADGAHVEMVEHILAALAGLAVDNCEVWVDAEEMPGCDGSALPFVEALDAAGIVEQGAPVRRLVVDRTIRVGDQNKWIEASPARARVCRSRSISTTVLRVRSADSALRPTSRRRASAANWPPVARSSCKTWRRRWWPRELGGGSPLRTC